MKKRVVVLAYRLSRNRSRSWAEPYMFHQLWAKALHLGLTGPKLFILNKT